MRIDYPVFYIALPLSGVRAGARPIKLSNRCEPGRQRFRRSIRSSRTRQKDIRNMLADLFAHVLAINAVIRGDNRSKWIAAATLDRYLQLIGKPQIFRSQYPFEPGVARQSDGTQNRFQG
jgi:hypothetical protein